jgi:hypothetical protein
MTFFVSFHELIFVMVLSNTQEAHIFILREGKKGQEPIQNNIQTHTTQHDQEHRQHKLNTDQHGPLENLRNCS